MEATRQERVERRRGRISRRREGTEGGFDYSLLLLTFVMLGFGMLMIYSSSSYTAQIKSGDSTYFLKKQAFNVAVGAVGMLVAIKFKYKYFIKPIPFLHMRFVTLIYLICVSLQVLVLVQGGGLNGANRWLNLGVVSFQPSELTKIGIIIITAYYLYEMPRKFSSTKTLVRVFVPVSLPLLLVAYQDLSSAIVIFIIAYGMCFMDVKNKMPLIILALIVLFLAYLYVFHIGSSFRADRIEIWKNPEGHPKGLQIVHGLYAIASGGLFGSGLGESMQKLGFLPEPYNDMIFSVICEELGLIGAGIVIVMFILLCWRIYRIASRCTNLFPALICTGVMIHIASQAIINIAVVTNTIPSTGIPLPLISYGGSSVIFLMMEIGIVLGISANTDTSGGRNERT
ncbi:MAG: putative lipid II flippase FtsW [Eubacterium sp.]|nr:putative lipid II flippase FtsW [Eubacterium sp.]